MKYKQPQIEIMDTTLRDGSFFILFSAVNPL